MAQPTLPLPRERDALILALCEDHLTREETLLADMLHSLRQVRAAFFERNLRILPTLHERQASLTRAAAAMASRRERLRQSLADHLNVPPSEATLRFASFSLTEGPRERLLRRHTQLCEQIRQAEQLAEQNAALLGHARAFLACLFSGVPGGGESYGPDGERRDAPYGSLLQARG